MTSNMWSVEAITSKYNETAINFLNYLFHNNLRLYVVHA